MLGRDIAKGLPADEVPAALARLLNAYAAARKAGEGFVAFTRRHDEAALRAMLTGAAP